MSQNTPAPDDGGAPTPTPPPHPASTPASEVREAAQIDPRLVVRDEGFKGYLTDFQRRIRGGELGSLPVIVGLIAIWAIFQSLNSRFLSAQNLSNLSVDIVPLGLISVGIVFVLLLGEIDLSAGSVSGACAAVVAVLNVNHGVNPVLSIVLAVLAGCCMGLIHGFFFAKIGVPAFVVTLAGMLVWNGVQLRVLGNNGTINLANDGLISKLTSHYFGQLIVAYLVAAAAVVGFFAVSFIGNRRRTAAGVPARTLAELVFRTAVLAVVAFGVAYTVNQYKGMPLALLIFILVVVATDFILRRTTYGRKVFAVGGTVEAARRAGISVPAIRISVYVISGAFAAVGGIFFASRISSASQATGQSNVLMMAIAAAVIGGTSLFGGRGSTYSAMLGALVIQSIQSGMALQGVSNSIQFIVTGVVLLAAVVIDSVSRRSQRNSGRR